MANSKKIATGKSVSKASPGKTAKLANQKASLQKSVKTADQKSASKPAAKPVSSGLIGRIKGALSKPKAAPATRPVVSKAVKPAAKSAKSATAASQPVASPGATAPAKPTAPGKNAKPTFISSPAPTAAPKQKARVSMKALSTLPLLTEDQIRAMSDNEYMNAQQLAFFRMRLLQMRDEVLQREVDVKERLHEREMFADPADRASAEEEHWLDLRLRERESLLLHKIDDALRRIESDEFGWCEKTGDAIGIPRLLARPTATVCVDVKGQDERVEAQFRDR